MQKPEIKKEFEIGCRAAEITPLLKEVMLEIDSAALKAEEIKFNLELAAREMLANAIEHGCALAAENDSRTARMKIRVELKISQKELIFTVRDPGPGFEWQKYDLKTMPKFEEKGRGLKMIYQVSDQIKFNSRGNKITAIFKVS